MADSLNRQIDDLCRLADRVIQNPSIKPEYVVKDVSFRSCGSVIGLVNGFAASRAIASNFTFGSFDSTEGTIGGAGTGAAIGAVVGGPIGAGVGAAVGGLVGFLWGRNNEREEELKREREKRAMLEKLIAKQQAVINKLNDQTYKNSQEIANLKEMIALLSAVIEKFKREM